MESDGSASPIIVPEEEELLGHGVPTSNFFPSSNVLYSCGRTVAVAVTTRKEGSVADAAIVPMVIVRLFLLLLLLLLLPVSAFVAISGCSLFLLVGLSSTRVVAMVPLLVLLLLLLLLLLLRVLVLSGAACSSSDCGLLIKSMSRGGVGYDSVVSLLLLGGLVALIVVMVSSNQLEPISPNDVLARARVCSAGARVVARGREELLCSPW